MYDPYETDKDGEGRRLVTDPQVGIDDQSASTRFPAGLVLAVVVGCELMLQLDTTIVAVALPNLQSDLSISATDLSWVVNGFALAFGGLLLLGGRLGDVLGYRAIFLTGTALFAAASVLAGLAGNFGWLLAGRVLQGAGAALAGPAGLALLSLAFSGDRRPRAFAVYSTVTGLGASAGLVIGGVIAWLASWRWTLLVNAPVGLAVVVVAVRVLRVPDQRADSGRPRLDLLGGALSIAGMSVLIYGLVHASEHGWGNSMTLGALLAGVVLLVAFWLVESKIESPMLPTRVLVHRERAIALAGAVLMAFVLTSFLFFSTQLLQHAMHLDPLLAGLAFLPFGVSLLLAARLAPQLLRRAHTAAAISAGFTLLLAGSLWLTRLDDPVSYWRDLLGPMLLLGIGSGTVVVPLNVLVLSTTAPEDSGITSGALQSALSVGGSLGVAVLLTAYAGAESITAGVARAFGGAAIAAMAAAILAAGGWLAVRRELRARAS